MPAKPWTPKVVGGTDHPSANMNVPVVEAGPLDAILNPSELLVETTHDALSRHASELSADLNPTWHYGPTIRVRDGVSMLRGQYVVEYHDGSKVKTYWVPS